MAHIQQAGLGNRLLSRLSPGAFGCVAAHLAPVTLQLGMQVVDPGAPCPFVLFPDSGVAAVVSCTVAGQTAEVGLFGRDGMGSTAIVLGAKQTPYAITIQMSGTGHRLPVAALHHAMQASPELTAALLQYVQAFSVQVSQTAMVNSCYTLEPRLARWLLMVHDRVDGNDLALTHGLLSTMLGVRRTGITDATHVLESEGMIRARHRLITITDRTKLEAMAQSGYGLAEQEYQSLLGPL